MENKDLEVLQKYFANVITTQAVVGVSANNVLSLMKKMTKLNFHFLQAVGETPAAEGG